MQKLSLILGTLALSTGAALAATDFVTLDADASKTLTLTELQATFADLTEDGFKAIDANADGLVDDAEFKAAVETAKLVEPAN